MPDSTFRVLVIDDDSESKGAVENAVRSFFFNYPKDKGYENRSVDHEPDAETGLGMIVSGNYDLVVLDINFDKQRFDNQDGLVKVLVPLRQQKNRIPVVCWSSDEGYKNSSRIAGADGFVKKGLYSESKTSRELAKEMNEVLFYREVMEIK